MIFYLLTQFEYSKNIYAVKTRSALQKLKKKHSSQTIGIEPIWTKYRYSYLWQFSFPHTCGKVEKIARV